VIELMNGGSSPLLLREGLICVLQPLHSFLSPSSLSSPLWEVTLHGPWLVSIQHRAHPPLLNTPTGRI
jgi:hypothetical protein